jgi:hypothetical protein
MLEGFTDVSALLGSGVYILLYRGKVVYVGQSVKMISRIYAHRSNKDRSSRQGAILPSLRGITFDKVFVMPCVREDLDAVERALIDAYKPRHNVHYKYPTPITAAIELSIGKHTVIINKPEAKPTPGPKFERRIWVMGLQRGHINPAKVSITGIRTLARTDLSLLTEKRPAVTLQKLRDTHHRVARAIASGLSNSDVAAICGISVNRVSMYKSDPAMMNLVAHYRATATADWVLSADSFLEIATANMLKAERMLSDELDQHDEEGTRPSVKDLIAISRDAADRFGYGKMQKNLNVNVDFAAQLEGARKRSRFRVIEASSSLVPQSDSPPLAPAPVSPGGGPSTFRRL